MWTYNSSYELYHHGILGQKWGVRRYQNEDGSLTPTGEKRYSGGLFGKIKAARDKKKHDKEEKRIINIDMVNDNIKYGREFDNTEQGKKLMKLHDKASDKLYNKYYDYYDNPDYEHDPDIISYKKRAQDYYYPRGQYIAKRLINTYGEEKFIKFANRWQYGIDTSRVHNIDDLINEFSEKTVDHDAEW